MHKDRSESLENAALAPAWPKRGNMDHIPTVYLTQATGKPRLLAASSTLKVARDVLRPQAIHSSQYLCARKENTYLQETRVRKTKKDSTG